MSEGTRSHWGSKAGFVLAAAGSAVGLGNLWKFPYITGENGGGAFVLVYLACILLVGVPIMVGEVFVGKLAQKGPVGAFGDLTPRGSPWKLVGALGVVTGFVILSYYSVVAGWAMHYVLLAARGTFSGADTPEEIAAIGAHFGALYADPTLNVLWHVAFMAITIAIVIAGVQKGVERAGRVLMPALLVVLAALAAYAATLSGFGRAVSFVFGLHTEDLTGAGVLEALGHSFFTLSLGMGAMITYGSYLRREDGVVATSFVISGLDTGVALLACLALFPITFTYGMEPAAGPGLVFVNMPTAFAQMPGGSVWATLFFVLLTFAALTSAVSLLEVVASYFIDELGWSRPRAVAVLGVAILLFGIPSALSGGTELFGSGFSTAIAGALGQERGKNWFDGLDYLASNWMLPLGGLGLALFAGWRLDDVKRRAALSEGGTFGRIVPLYLGWLWLLRIVAPIAIVLVMLHAIGLL
ncbi:MAG: sodium-dependent transporter [Sandaracinaceae bacterium]|nr:sodium-dependent transporter [Sandaracinaceae bacterium]